MIRVRNTARDLRGRREGKVLIRSRMMLRPVREQTNAGAQRQQNYLSPVIKGHFGNRKVLKATPVAA